MLSKTLRPGSHYTIRIMSSMPGPVECIIKNKLETSLEASLVNIINESYMHNVPKGAETHFKVLVVSNKFDGLPLIKVNFLSYFNVLVI
ncbi:unnamed protein product [Diatraea saccharalis]|uniref:Uncharacterized protein n=1 Tax=Diatraea saccharalis TaxID=40085 RepID=A0A9P0C2Z3_9NEOP|nr:unnamed protein product [Diatraea saccharalis]